MTHETSKALAVVSILSVLMYIFFNSLIIDYLLENRNSDSWKWNTLLALAIVNILIFIGAVICSSSIRKNNES